MRILLIHNSYQQRGGEDTVFESEYNLLSERGNDVEKILFDNKAIASLGDTIMTGFKNIFNPNSARIIEEKIISFKPEVIHTHNFFPLISPSVFFVAKKHKIPILMTLHNYRLICSNAILYRDGHICEDCVKKIIPLNGIIHKCYHNSVVQTTAVTLMTSFHKIAGTWKNKIDKYIALTEFGRDKILNSSLKLSEDQVVVKQNFVEDFGDGNNNREEFFVFIGRIIENKGIETLLESLKHFNYKIKIIGDGPLRSRIEDAALQNKNIEYLGFRDKNFIINTLKKTRGLLFPSLWYEGLPMTVLEAFSTGTPVIGSNIGSLQLLIKDNYNGFHFRPGDAKDLAARIKYLSDNEQQLKHLYVNARNTYLEKYTPEKNYEQLINIYSEVILNEKKKNN